MLSVSLLDRRRLHADVLLPRALIRLGGQLRLFRFEFFPQRSLHELRRCFPLLLVGYVAILQRLRLDHSLHSDSVPDLGEAFEQSEWSYQ